MIFLDQESGVRFCLSKIDLPRPYQNENGGYLIGRIIIDSNDYVVDHFTQKMGADISSPNSLHLIDPGHSEKINELWRESNGTSHLLGHWHTHCEPIPEPSSIDLKSWEKMSKEVSESSGLSPLLCLIVGIKQTRAFAQFKETIGLKELILIDDLTRQ